MKNTLRLIFSQKLLNTVVDFCMNTDNFANFGLRFLEILSLEYAEAILKSEILAILSGLLRTNDYETVTQALSFISVLCETASIAQAMSKPPITDPSSAKPQSLSVNSILTKQMLVLVMKTVQRNPEIEYVHYAIQIVNHALSDPTLRKVITSEELERSNPMVEAGAQEQLSED